MKTKIPLFALTGILLLVAIFLAAIAAPATQAQTSVLINEVDSDTPGTDAAEFVELYDGGAGNTALDGLVVVFYNGSSDTSYNSFDLDGFATNADGYFLLGNSGVSPTPDITFGSNGLQNGPDAVALYEGDAATNFPNGTAVTTTNLLDAIIYDTNDGDDAGLLVLLNPGQPQVNEAGAGDKDNHSNQRCPNGSGGALNTDSYLQRTPTPGAENNCPPPPPPFGSCSDPFTPIYDIQGNGASSPLNGEMVVTEGIVTVDLQKSSQLRGFFIQDRKGDGDPATSDGLFVYFPEYYTNPSFNPSVGDLVRLRGTITEYYNDTELGQVDVATICGTGFQLNPTNVLARDFNANAESYEGMYVRFPRQMFVTDTYNQHRFGEIWLAEKGVVEQPTNEYPVGPDAEAFAEDNMARSVLLDDSSTYEYPNTIPYVGKDGTLRLGDTVNPLVGAINYAFSEYRIQPQDPGSVRFIPRNARPGEPNNKGNLVIASANVLNYFTTLDEGQDNCGPTGDKECRGAETQEQLDVQTEKLVAELLGTGADIIGLQEIENNPSDTPIETLVAALNAAEGGGDWSWIGKLDHYNEYPVRNEIIYRQDRVEPIGGPVTIADSIFDDQTGRDDPIGRPPVAQTFEFNGETFTVVNNHLKSKGCDGATGLDEDQGNGQSCFNDTRVAQAKRVLEFVNDLIAETRDPDVIVLGDMNSYLYEEPILTFETELVNLVSEWDKDPYSYSFFATYAAPWIGRGLLDYALATPSMADQVKRTEVWHINADEPRFLDWYDPDIVAPGPYRAADHDPVVVSLKIR